MSDDVHIAASWPELRAESEQDPAATQNLFLWYFGQLDKRAPDEVRSGPELWGAAGALTHGALLEKPDAMAAFLSFVLPRVAAVSDASDPGLARDSAINLGALALHDLAAAGLADAPPGDPDVLIDRLLAREPLSEKFALRTAWAALAHGRTEGLKPVLPADPGDAPPDAGQPFGQNDERILLHLFRCVRDGANPEVAQPAWEAWVKTFPLKLASDWSSWPEFLWSARAVHCVIGGDAPDGLVAWLRGQIP
ncbi:hypothetical protein RGUI_3671 [Rhodovulum sp. P5]|uniref:hypothetical protein n=1 Tax=Rhodovulum sp. P5 TaxID=1564506 RepID=UPI0009C2F879|nr:hypothetical protein [Rhodovulum sp. P5]ARE41812.1 hypothetical protein RGUI_3671 [Rhodovulum sp. P5]